MALTNKYRKTGKETVVHVKKRKEKRANLETPKVAPKIDPKIDPKNNDPN